MSRSHRKPPHWTIEQLAETRLLAQQQFIERRKTEGQAVYQEAFREVTALIEHALTLTGDLTRIDGKLLVEHNQLWQLLRYFCGPQISEEDYWTLVGKKFVRVREEYADAAAEVINDLLDTSRIPWIPEKRLPTPAERTTAILSTATLLAHEKHRTDRRGLISKTQEDEVAAILKVAGLRPIDSSERQHISAPDDLPLGSFCKEQKIMAAKCDVPCRLFDGRLLALECKVSNGPKNGWKRLLREVGGKADTWKQSFDDQLITGAVIAGVFDLKCLERAQNEHHIAIFWQHDLGPLQQFIELAKKPSPNTKPPTR
jgi:hypothetical protein